MFAIIEQAFPKQTRAEEGVLFINSQVKTREAKAAIPLNVRIRCFRLCFHLRISTYTKIINTRPPYGKQKVSLKLLKMLKTT